MRHRLDVSATTVHPRHWHRARPLHRYHRGGEHHQVLDPYEGAAAADSTIATQLAQITGQIAEHKDQAGYAGTAAKLRVAASVFGVL